jgi:signal transduction histidine kinase
MIWTLGAGWTQKWVCGELGLVALAELLLLWRQERRHVAQRRRARQLRRELEIYGRLDATFPLNGDERELAVRVCRVTAEYSPFKRAALLLEGNGRRLHVAGSAGFDDVTLEALNAWGAESWLRGEGQASFPITLRPRDEVGVMDIEAVHCRRALILPLETSAGRMVGALAVGLEEDQQLDGEQAPLEVLAVKLARTVENRQLTERLLRAERLAGPGRLAGELVQELDVPLTAALGYAELIAESSKDERVREDARRIVHEARRAQEKVAQMAETARPEEPWWSHRRGA